MTGCTPASNQLVLLRTMSHSLWIGGPGQLPGRGTERAGWAQDGRASVALYQYHVWSGPKCYQACLSCSIVIVSCRVMSLTLFVTLCTSCFGHYRFTMLHSLSLSKWVSSKLQSSKTQHFIEKKNVKMHDIPIYIRLHTQSHIDTHVGQVGFWTTD